MPFGGSENRPHTLQQCRRAARRRSGLRGDGARGLAIVPTAHGPRSESMATAVQEPVAIDAAGGSEPVAEQSEMTLTNPHQRRSAKTARRAPATRRDETTEGPDSSRSPRRAGRPPTARLRRAADRRTPSEVRTPRTPDPRGSRRRRAQQSSASCSEPHSRPIREEQSPQTPTTSVPHEPGPLHTGARPTLVATAADV